jgi:hypothetical protein
MTVAGGFRNPVHHHYHIQTNFHAPESVHQYGGAVDFSIADAPLVRVGAGPPRRLTTRGYFDAIEDLAHDPTVAGCFEPADMIISGAGRLNHAHVDWGRVCPRGW